MAAVPGDIVRHNTNERVVVDVTDDGFAVLRRQDDPHLNEPTVALVGELEVVGHVRLVDGWVELGHGIWEQV
jgi:hypothetical protein